ncbi:MAG: hypothetical protein D6762_00725 [Candidatus Neomarinimicrobiota bacterium]|nr:MAG: hypothetical protein D6762_00725 [Candidatus Neomarinimicrobiota bacterium]
MNRIPYYKSVIFLIGALAFFPAVGTAALQKPVSGGDQKEVLVIAGKRRLYYHLQESKLVYTLVGPARVEIISRYSSARKKRSGIPYSFTLVLDATDTVHVRHRFQISKSIRSVQHPNDYFTHSGNDYLNLGKGRHSLELIPTGATNRPVLIRVLTHDFPDRFEEKTWLTPTTAPTAVRVLTQEKEIPYYEVTHAIPLQVSLEGEHSLKIISRLAFEPWMGPSESYRIQVAEGKKILGTFLLQSERSGEATSPDRPDIVPGKWRSCIVEMPPGEHHLTVKILDRDRKALLRFMEYK